MSNPLIGIIVGSSRQGRFAEVPAHWIYRMAERRIGVGVELIDLGNHLLPFFGATATAASPPGDERAAARRWALVLDRLDGFVVVSSEETAGRTPCSIAAAGCLQAAFARKPVAFVGYGGTTGDEGMNALRSVALALQMAPVQEAVRIPRREAIGIWQQGKTFDDFPHLARAATAMLDDLIWWARALKAARNPGLGGGPVAPQPAAPAHAAPAKPGFLHAFARRVRWVSAIRSATTGYSSASGTIGAISEL
ncbi:NADPH-dependent FMN reductase [Variovorax saccharolyticus]|uniref:NADPH-dependent FMN reductase n=1 Tax=Variovorax saccharolyticus TaxID=3053516 RepID=UPI002578DB5A|nr:NAD(P)H-dependent oxidoreductase [Variovorax sp. J31P216]MDM0025506.1 NAD(P)H-dependent oxidoreductase [Variovorax sp. J31P216]